MAEPESTARPMDPAMVPGVFRTMHDEALRLALEDAKKVRLDPEDDGTDDDDLETFVEKRVNLYVECMLAMCGVHVDLQIEEKDDF